MFAQTPVGNKLNSPTVVGRFRELRMLEDRISQTLAGDGTFVLLSGEAGIGKSRLIEEARARFLESSRENGTVIQANCYEVSLDYPYAPFDDLISRINLSPPARFSDSDAANLSLLAGSTTSGTDYPSYKRRAIVSLRRFITGMAQQRPLLFILEDLQWADEASLDLLLDVTRFIDDQPILILCSFRSDETHEPLRNLLGAFDRERRGIELRLQALTRADIDTMLREMFQQVQPIRPDFLDIVSSVTEGNPFFIEEIVNSLIADGGVFQVDGQWQRKETHELIIPRSIHDAVWRRASKVSDRARHVLSLAAVSGRNFSFRVIQRLTGHSEEVLLSAIRELISHQLINEESADHFSFRHALTRQTVYAELLVRERRSLHREVAEAILQVVGSEDDHVLSELAYHFDRAEDWERAHAYTVRAGDRASSLFAPRAAAEHYTRALRAASQLGLHADPHVYRNRALAYLTFGRFDAANSDLETALELARGRGDTHLEWETLLDLGGLWTGRDYQRAGHYFALALDKARRSENQDAIARSLVQIGNVYVNTERMDEAEEALNNALAIFETIDNKAGRAEAMDLLGVVADLQGDQRTMRARYELATQLYREVNNRKGVISTKTNLSTTAGGYVIFEAISIGGGLPKDEVEKTAWDIVQSSREIDWASGEAYALMSLAIHYLAQGEFGLATELGEKGMRIASEIAHQEWMIVGHSLQGHLKAELMRPEHSASSFEQGLALANASASPLWQHVATGFLASSQVSAGKLDEAVALLEPVIDAAPMNTLGSRVVWTAMARLELARGAPASALHIVDELFATARNMNQISEMPALALLRGRILSELEQVEPATSALEAALHGARTYELQPLEWRVHLALAELHNRAGRADEATWAYDHVRLITHRLAERIPDTDLRSTFLDRVHALLPSQTSAHSSLTPREQQVAELVELGQSNREIADALFIGERTVETHVGNILAKRGVSSRAQLIAQRIRDTADDPGQA